MPSDEVSKMWSFMVSLLITIVSADKLDRLYLPPPNANYAGGNPGNIEVPFESSKLSQSVDYTNLPENVLSGFGPDNISTGLASYDPNMSVKNIDFFPSTTDQTYAQTSSLPQADKNNIYGRIDMNEYPFEGNENLENLPGQFSIDLYKPKLDNASNMPLTILSQSNLNSPVEQNILSNMEGKTIPISDLITPVSTQGSFNSNKNHLSPTSIEYPNDNANPPLFVKQYTHRPSFNNAQGAIFPSKTKFNEAIIQHYPERVQAEADRNAAILNYENVITPEGYAYSYDTSNGIHADENGTTVDGLKVKGSYSYIGDDGKNYTVYYTADENGFQPRGDHLPTPPPIPDTIKKAMEHIAENERNGIFNDGSYDDNKYGYKNYHNPGLSGNALNGNIYAIPGNLPNDEKYSSGVANDKQRLSQSKQKVAPNLGDESFVDKYIMDYDTDNDFENDGNNLKQLIKPMNVNIQQRQYDRYRNNPFKQHFTLTPSSNENTSSTETFLPNKNDILFKQDTNIQTDDNKPDELNNQYDVESSTTLAPANQLGYEYLTPQIRLAPKVNSFLSHYNKHDGPSRINPSISPISQQPYKSQPVIYNKPVKSPILQNKYQSYDDDGYDGSPEKYVAKTEFLVTSPEQAANLSAKQNIRPVSTSNFIPFADSEYVYPNEYTNTLMPSQISIKSGIYRPRGDIRDPGKNFELSTTVKPSLFTNNPGTTETYDDTVVSSTLPIFHTKTSEGVHNEINSPNEKVSQETGTITSGLDPIPKDYSQPRYSSTTATFGTPEYVPDQNHQTIFTDVYKIQPSTEKSNGEDFSGPKQVQRYDPITGYHYK